MVFILPEPQSYAGMSRPSKYGKVSSDKHLDVLEGPHYVAGKFVVGKRVGQFFFYLRFWQRGPHLKINTNRTYYCTELGCITVKFIFN